RVIGPLFCLAPVLERPRFSLCSTRWQRKLRHAKFGGCTGPATEPTTLLRRSNAPFVKCCRTAAVEYYTAGLGPTIVWVSNLTALDTLAYPCSMNLVCLATRTSTYVAPPHSSRT